MPPPGTARPQALAQDVKTDAESVLAAATELENELHELKAKYDMYFLGMEKIEPAKQREDLRKRIVDLKNRFIRNTGAKFKAQGLMQKYLTYERLWQKTAKDMEDGTSRRDQFLVRYRQKRHEDEEKKKPAQVSPGRPAAQADFDIDEAPAHRAPPAAPKKPPPLPAAARAPAPVASDGGLTDDKVKAIYNAYVTAKRRCNESTAGISLESVAASIKKQVPKIMDEYKAKGVDFKVVIKDGKAVLKAVPK